MTSLQSRLRAFKDELLGVCDRVYHYHRGVRSKAPYLIWAEDGEGDQSFYSDSRKSEQSIHGYIDYFTLEEFDPAVDNVQNILYVHGSEWRLNDVQYEEDTNLIHYAWEFTI